MLIFCTKYTHTRILNLILIIACHFKYRLTINLCDEGSFEVAVNILQSKLMIKPLPIGSFFYRDINKTKAIAKNEECLNAFQN